MKEEYRFWFYSLIVTGSVLISICSCQKEISATLPELSTSPITNITSSSLTCGGKITSEGGSIVIARGVCWSTHSNPTVNDNIITDGTGSGSFISVITGLESGTDYYLRAFATNGTGTAYGNAFVLITPLADIDGNIYNTVIIGNVAWMAENLKTTKYNDNTRIPNVTVNSDWSSLSTPGYCWYNNDAASGQNKFGAFYNWYAVNTGKLCPTGWHVPSEADWTALTDCLGGDINAGGRLKEVGTLHWMSPNEGATNDFGFTALPGGYRTGLSAGNFRALGYIGWWWASTESDVIWARSRTIAFDVSEIAKGQGYKKNGYSVRCVKD
jgi:uncharacterized protein (TIGR02145 family)